MLKFKRILGVLLIACLIIGVLPAVSQPTNAASAYELEVVGNPVIGGTYYLAANVDGQLLTFTPGGVTETEVYSLKTVVVSASAKMVTLEDPTLAQEGKSTGFQLAFANGEKTNRIYCYTAVKNDPTVHTGSHEGNPSYRGRHTFEVATVNGESVVRKVAHGTNSNNNYVLVVKKIALKAGGEAWRMQCVPETELQNEGVYPVALYAEHTEHTYNNWSFDTESGTQSRLCTVCGLAETLYGTDVKGSMVTEPVIGQSYYLAANANGKLIFFRHGTATDTVPYSLVATDNFEHNWVLPVTVEDPTTANEGTEVGFQLVYNRPDDGSLLRIYCYDVLKNPAEQTGVMDTGINSVNYRGRHTFEIAQANGMKVLRKLSNNNILVAKYNETKKEWRMLGVPATELGQPGVYPAMLMNIHTHTYGSAYEKDESSHWQICDCGAASAKEGHNFVDGQCTCGKSGSAVTLEEGIYYLKATRSGVTYYFRHALSGESVSHTLPYSLYTDTDRTAAKLVDVIQETSGSFSLAYPYNSNTARIYVYDVGANGSIDTGVNTANVEVNHHFRWDDENGWLYQMEGTVKYVLALKEMDNTNTGTKQIRMLAVPEYELSATVVPMNLEAHTQHSCDTWVVNTPATTSSTGLKTGICTVCGREIQEVIPVLAPAFSGKSISLQDDFSINFYVEKAAFADGVYGNPYVIFELDGEQTTVTAYTQKDDYYIFTFDGITPDKMGQKVQATLYADKQDGTQFSVTKDYSVAEYCYAALELEQATDAFRRLLVDTLNFGAVCQQYRNSDIAAEELVNAALTEEQKSWGSGETIREIESCRDFGKNNGSVKWYGVSALMGDRVQMRLYFLAEDATDLTIQAVSNSGEWTLNDIKAKDGMYYVDFAYLNPAQMNEKVSFTVYQGENAVSSMLDYSIESYAAVWVNKTDARPEQVELVKAIIRYGDAAKAYVDRVYDLQEDVRYLGRTYKSGGTQWFNWSASGFCVRFQGSGLKAKIASNAPNATNYAYLKVYVDGVEQPDILLNQTMQTVILAEGLNPDEIHTVEVRKRNSPRSSTAGLLSIELLDGKKLAPPEEKEKLIEFIGDSLTVGYSAADADKSETAWSTATEDGTKTYSKQVADALGAEYMVTAISGRGVVMNNGGADGYLLPDIYPELDIYNMPGTAYDFALQPDVIVINLGTNDATNAGLKITTFQTGVYNFLKTVRQKNPNAQIIWAYGLRSDKMTAQVAGAIEAAVAQLKTEGDSKVHYLALPLAADMHLNHPTAAAYEPSGELLIEKIEEITGW